MFLRMQSGLKGALITFQRAAGIILSLLKHKFGFVKHGVTVIYKDPSKKICITVIQYWGSCPDLM